jgi:hypothetical protein
MHNDDIDWVNAASDCGLIALCREIEALTQPPRFSQRPKRRAPPPKPPRDPVRASADVVAIFYP